MAVRGRFDVFLGDLQHRNGVITQLNHWYELHRLSEVHNPAKWYEMWLKLVKNPRKCMQMDVFGLRLGQITPGTASGSSTHISICWINLLGTRTLTQIDVHDWTCTIQWLNITDRACLCSLKKNQTAQSNTLNRSVRLMAKRTHGLNTVMGAFIKHNFDRCAIEDWGMFNRKTFNRGPSMCPMCSIGFYQ